jgi:DNA-binding FadR family transcriptional regulator
MQNTYKPLSSAPESLEDQPELVDCLVKLRTLIQEIYLSGERKLPPERQLAQRFGVGRGTLRKALAVLEDEKTIARHVGRGTFLASGAGAAPPQIQALASGGALAIDSVAGLSPRELMEVRYALEPAIAELAAMAATPADLARIREHLNKREQASGLDDYEYWDYALHMSIAQATHNTLLTELLDLINRIRRTAAWRQFRQPSVEPGERKHSNAHHREVFQAIARADPAAAFNAMRLHLREVAAHYQHYASVRAPAPWPDAQQRGRED